MPRAFCLFALLAFAFTCPVSGESKIVPLKTAHAHNDYYHPRPLLDALEQGFCSVEADVFLRNELLLVAHSADEIKPERTLQKLYLDPLRERCRANGGRVFPNGPTFTLLVDIKSSGPDTYRRIHEVLSDYREMLTTINENVVTEKGVRIVISGNRPEAILVEQSLRYATVDGRLGDLGSEKPIHLMPLISDRWTSHFKWRGVGPIPTAEREKLVKLVKQAHQEGRLIRFWATADTVEMWRELKAANVDYINTDDLPGLGRFLR